MRRRISGFTYALAILLIAGCASKDDSGSNAGDPGEAADAPYAAYAGDWMMEAYAADAAADAEPLTVTLMKATADGQGWTTKFTHMDDPVPASVSMDGDSIQVVWGSYPSQLREGATVRQVVATMAAYGDNMNGRFSATYEGDDETVLTGTLKGERIE